MRVGNYALALLALLPLAGCENPTGTTLVFYDPTGTAKTAWLYVASDADTQECTKGLTPKDVSSEFAGDVLLLEEDAGFAVDFEDGRAVFVLRPLAGQDQRAVAKLALVAFDGQEQVVAAATFQPTRAVTQDTVAFRIDLEPAESARAPSNAATPDQRVYAWGPPAPEAPIAPCFAIEHANGTTEPDRTWFVPPDDKDCDGLDDECDACRFEQMAPVSATPGWMNRTCSTVTSGTLLGEDRTCEVGAALACPADPGNPNEVCDAFSAPSYCFPSEHCGNEACLRSPGSCSLPDGATQVACEFPATPASEPCADVASRRAFLNLGDGDYPLTGCVGASLLSPNDVFGPDLQFASLQSFRITTSSSSTIITSSCRSPSAKIRIARARA